jgi:hypothetical protein
VPDPLPRLSATDRTFLRVVVVIGVLAASATLVSATWFLAADEVRGNG